MPSLDHSEAPSYATNVLPVTLAEMKLHSRFQTAGSDEDDLLNGLLAAAVIRAERITGRSIVEHKYVQTLDYFPYCVDARGLVTPDAIRLERGPVKSVESFTYIDTAGTQQTMVADTDYLANLSSVPPVLVPAYSKCWPSAQNYFKTVVVNYTAGYTTVPDDLKQAVRLLFATWYDERTSLISRSVDELPVPFGVSAILSSYKRRRIA